MDALGKLLLAGAAGLAAGAAARAALRRARRFDFAGKTCLVTGGSRGLGLVLARQLASAGARVAILARTQADLDNAADDLRARGAEVLALACDVSRPEEVHSAVQQVERRFGSVDVLFNVAGVIQVGPLEAMTREDFRQAMDVHFWAQSGEQAAAQILRACRDGEPRMGGIGQHAAYGYESASRLSPSLLTRAGDAAARRNNEMRGRPA